MRHTEPKLIDLPPEMRDKLEAFRTEHADDPIGDVASQVIFEDDKLKIWEMTLQPGQASDLHHHALDYYLAIFEGDYVAGVPPKDSGVDIFLCEIPSQGNTVFIPKGGTEWAYNVGQKTFREVLIELKDS